MPGPSAFDDLAEARPQWTPAEFGFNFPGIRHEPRWIADPTLSVERRNRVASYLTETFSSSDSLQSCMHYKSEPGPVIVLGLAIFLLSIVSAPVRACTIFVLTDETRTLFCNNEDYSNHFAFDEQRKLIASDMEDLELKMDANADVN